MAILMSFHMPKRTQLDNVCSMADLSGCTHVCAHMHTHFHVHVYAPSTHMSIRMSMHMSMCIPVHRVCTHVHVQARAGWA